MVYLSSLQVQSADTAEGESGVTVTIAGLSTTTGDNGRYSITIPDNLWNQPGQVILSKSGFHTSYFNYNPLSTMGSRLYIAPDYYKPQSYNIPTEPYYPEKTPPETEVDLTKYRLVAIAPDGTKTYVPIDKINKEAAGNINWGEGISLGSDAYLQLLRDRGFSTELVDKMAAGNITWDEASLQMENEAIKYGLIKPTITPTVSGFNLGGLVPLLLIGMLVMK